MKTKRIIALLLAVVMCFSVAFTLASCEDEYSGEDKGNSEK